MNGTLNLSRNLIIVATPLALFGALIFLMKSPILSTVNNFDLAITIDLVVSVPFIYYLLIRKAGVPNTTVVPVIMIGVVIGSYFLPEDNRLYLNHFLHLCSPITLMGVYGIKKQAKKIAVYVDEPKAFKSKLEEGIKEKNEQ